MSEKKFQQQRPRKIPYIVGGIVLILAIMIALHLHFAP
jgi:hypothetical protein